MAVFADTTAPAVVMTRTGQKNSAGDSTAYT
jgi:hypothetical protein